LAISTQYQHDKCPGRGWDGYAMAEMCSASAPLSVCAMLGASKSEQLRVSANHSFSKAFKMVDFFCKFFYPQ